ncbi:MAG: class I SAM-dependent methyltransferase [Chitinophagales bacterium]
MNQALKLFGQTDIYLIDQILKGTYDDCKNILEVGCGNGRNLHYFLNQNFNVSGIDLNSAAIENCKMLANDLSTKPALTNFKVEDVCSNTLKEASFDLVISNAVFHFANNLNHFENMLFSTWKLIKPNGFLFCRLASNIGIEGFIEEISTGKYLLPDGSQRFLVNQHMLLNYTHNMQGELHEPIKTTNVQNLRCMTTWCLRKKPQ